MSINTDRNFAPWNIWQSTKIHFVHWLKKDTKDGTQCHYSQGGGRLKRSSGNGSKTTFSLSVKYTKRIL